MRIAALAAAGLCLAGCFVFDNPFDIGPRAAIIFQVVVQGGPQPGTYVWSSQTSAYERVIGGVRYRFYMDGTGYWRWEKGSGIFISSSVSTHGALPPTLPSGWAPSDQLVSVDDSEGGISGSSPDGPVYVGDTLQVGFSGLLSGVSAAYQWQGSNTSTGSSWTTLGTGNTYYVLDAALLWIRVIVTPTDNEGKHGTPAISAPVRVS